MPQDLRKILPGIVAAEQAAMGRAEQEVGAARRGRAFQRDFFVARDPAEMGRSGGTKLGGVGDLLPGIPSI